MPMSAAFESRLSPILPDLVTHYGTPFHIYDEAGILATGAALKQTFADVPGFREFFAVKALPNPAILALMQKMGFGFDCSSIPELILSRQVGATAPDIMFTSNNTTPAEFAAALDGGCILNLDDISLIERVPHMPDLICFRYNPGARRSGNAIIGKPEEAKYGITHEQVIPAYERARERGASQFGLHTMIVSNERDVRSMIQTISMLLDLATTLHDEIGIVLSFINMGGGLGIPYHPDDSPLDLAALGQSAAQQLANFETQQGYAPHLYMESGRYITGPHGVLVTQAINTKDTCRRYIGVDASMSALMRPGMYGAYHHITVHGKANDPAQTVDVVGALCENNDKFAIQRVLPAIEPGDILLIHDTGAHGQSMGFNYNGRLRPKELLLRHDGQVELIRRAETFADYTATLHYDPDIWRP